MNIETVDRIIREKERHHLTGVPTPSWWRLEKAGKAPKGFKIGPSSKGWRLSCLQAWMDACANGEAYHANDSSNQNSPLNQTTEK